LAKLHGNIFELESIRAEKPACSLWLVAEMVESLADGLLERRKQILIKRIPLLPRKGQAMAAPPTARCSELKRQRRAAVHR
jgi:hypothetical protein